MVTRFSCIKLPLPNCARLDSLERLSPRGSVCFQPPGFAQHIAYFGQEVLLLRRRERYRRILGGDAHDGAVEMVESVFINDGSNFAGQASGAGVLVQQDDFVGLAHGGGNGFAIQRRDRAQVQHFDFDPFFA